MKSCKGCNYVCEDHQVNHHCLCYFCNERKEQAADRERQYWARMERIDMQIRRAWYSEGGGHGKLGTEGW